MANLKLGDIVKWDGRDAEVMRIDSLTPLVYHVKLCGGRGGWARVGPEVAPSISDLSAVDARVAIKGMTARGKLVAAYHQEVDGKQRSSVLFECKKRAGQLGIEL